MSRRGAVLSMASACVAGGPARSHPALRVAMAQLALEDGDLGLNIGSAEQMAAEAATRKPDLFCIPEAADYGWLHQQGRRNALPIPGRYTEALSALARRYRMWVSAGCLERAGDHVYNSAVIIDRAGEIVHKHRKIQTLPKLTSHIYDEGSREAELTVDTEFGRIGLTICADNFDLTIPQRAAQAGAWLLIAPHGFAAPVQEMEKNAREYAEHIHKLAARTGMWVVAPNVARGLVKGGAWQGQMHCGRSRVVAPDGNVIALGKFNEPDLVICDIPAASAEG